MSIRKGLSILSIGLLVITAGCSSLFDSSASQNEQAAENAVNEDGLVAITEYTGEGYGLNGHDEEEELALANREEVEDAAKSYMKEFYNTDVEVQRISGSPGAVTVIVRSTGEISFNTYVIVPVDVENEEIQGEEAFSEEGQVEGAIISGLYYVIWQDEFMKYEEMIQQFVKENQLAVFTEEAIETTKFTGYSSPYLQINMAYEEHQELLDVYLERNLTEETDWTEYRGLLNTDPRYTLINTKLFMGNPDDQPDQKIYDSLHASVAEASNLPAGSYRLALYDHFIEPKSSTNNSLEGIEAYQADDIVKE